MSWLTSLFSAFTLNPGLAAAGIGLVAAPIVIHLINRMRFRTVRFAAIEFLLASQQKNRRRVLLEQLLLLLLRILIVAALVMLISRLVLDGSALSLLRAGARTHHVILIDDSGSMRNRLGDGTAFEKAKAIVRQFVSEAARETTDQQLTLMLLSQAESNETLISERDINETLVADLDTHLANLSATHQALSFPEGLEAARRWLRPDSAGQRVLHIVSDFRQIDWLDQPARLASLVDLGNAGISVNLVRVVGEETSNLGVTSIDGDLAAVAAGIPARVRVGVTNFGRLPAEEVSLGVRQDEQALPLSGRFDSIEPGAEAFTEFDIAFPAPGRAALRFEIQGDDSLPADNERFAAVDVAPSLPLLIIEGTPGQGDGPGLVVDALAAAPDLSGVSPRVEQIDFLRRESLGDYRAIYLINVPSLPRDAVRALERYVESGGGIVWFLGDAVQPAAYNADLYVDQSKANDTRSETTGQGAGNEKGFSTSVPYLFPVPLAPTRLDRERDESAGAIDIAFEPVGRFAPFAEELGKYWRGSHVESLLPVAEEWTTDDERRSDGVQTVARLKHGRPIIFRHEYGQGQIVTVLTSAGQSWTNWPRQFIYVPFMLELFKELATKTSGGTTRPVGVPIAWKLPAARFDSEVRVVRPDGSPDSVRLVPEAGDEADTDQTLYLAGDYSKTDQPGIYKAITAPVASGALRETWYAMNAPAAESRLRLADPEQLAGALSESPNITIRNPGETGWLRVEDAGHEARLWLVGLLVALLVAEQALAYRLSYHTRGKLAAA